MYAKTTKEVSRYVGKTKKMDSDIHIVVETRMVPKFAAPEYPPDGAARIVKKLWEKEIDAIATREDQLEHNLRHLFDLIWGQCTDVL
jgi:hypothetical protein